VPLGQPLPEILTMPPPVSLDDDDDDEYLRRQQSELDRYKNRNRNLEEDLRRFTDGKQMGDQNIQAQYSQYSRGVQGSNVMNGRDQAIQGSLYGVNASV
jgi:hypothetical protein